MAAAKSQKEFEEQLAFMDLAEEDASNESGDVSSRNSAEIAQPSLLNDIKNYGKNAAKALAIGTHRLGRALGPTFEGDLSTKGEKGVERDFRSYLDEVFPSEPGGAVTETTERFLQNVPTYLASPGASVVGTLARTGAGAIAAQGVKELGGGETAQEFADLLAYVSPDLGKKILGSKKSQEWIRWAREKGLSDKEIAPLIRDGKLGNLFSYFSKKGQRARTALQNTKGAISDLYSSMRSSPEGTKVLSKPDELFVRLKEDISHMPSHVRKAISDDVNKLIAKPSPTNADLLEFWQDVNAAVATDPDNLRRLVNLKEPIYRHLLESAPQLAKDFQMTNALYGKYSNAASRLKSGIKDQLIDAAEHGAFLYGLTTGNLPLLISVIGEGAARRLATEMLINPRFQQLIPKMVSALNQNKVSVLKHLVNLVQDEIIEEAPEAAKELASIDWDQWGAGAS